MNVRTKVNGEAKMGTARLESTSIETAAENLINYALEREGLKQALMMLPEDGSVNRVPVEYEIQLLKIITVGWSINYFMEEQPEKERLAQSFWNGIQLFSKNLNEMTSLTVGQDIDYFETVRQRLESYVAAMNSRPDIKDPAAVFGPAFAELAGHGENIHVIMAGNRIFNSALAAVREYLADIEFE
jgi:hypothetical protein